MDGYMKTMYDRYISQCSVIGQTRYIRKEAAQVEFTTKHEGCSALLHLGNLPHFVLLAATLVMLGPMRSAPALPPRQVVRALYAEISGCDLED